MLRRNQEEYQGRLNGENHYSRLNGENKQTITTITDATENFKDACDQAKKEIKGINFAPLGILLAIIIIAGLAFLNYKDFSTIPEMFDIPSVTKSDTGIVVNKFYKEFSGSYRDKEDFYVTVEREVVTSDGKKTTEVDDYSIPYKHYIQMEIGTVVNFEDDELVSYEPITDTELDEEKKEQ